MMPIAELILERSFGHNGHRKRDDMPNPWTFRRAGLDTNRGEGEPVGKAYGSGSETRTRA